MGRSETGACVWAGVDVGARRKGFHLALVDADRFLYREQAKSADEAVLILEQWKPALVAVDSPLTPATAGKSRPEEVCLAKAICGIRYTPTRGVVEGGAYYEWIRCGWVLYDVMKQHAIEAIECFPTASWTVWGGRRSGTRARWSQGVLLRQGLEGIPDRLNQDFRDAIAAALTARAHTRGASIRFGEIVVPAGLPLVVDCSG